MQAEVPYNQAKIHKNTRCSLKVSASAPWNSRVQKGIDTDPVIPPKNHVRGFQTKSGEVNEVFIGIIAMLADATDVFASGTNAPGCLLDKGINLFNAFSYFLGKIF